MTGSVKARSCERRMLQNRPHKHASRLRRKPSASDTAASTWTEQISRVRESDQNSNEIPSSCHHSAMEINVTDDPAYAQQALGDCTLVTPLQSLRTDPFDCLPIQNRPYIPQAIDFFFELFGSPYVYRPELVNVKQPSEFQRQYFRFAMQHEVLFQSVMTLSLACLQAMNEPRTFIPTKEVLFHHTNALKALRQKLSKPSGYSDDSVLLSILTLLGVVYFYGSIEAFGVHLAGLHRVLESRGGARTSSWFLFVQSRTLTYDSLRTHNESERHRIRPLETLTYAEHPYSPHLCERITELPPGFQELCLRGHLSLQTIDILSRAQAWTLEMKSLTDGTIGPSHSNVMEPSICAKLLQNDTLRPLEQCLCVAIMAYHLDAFPKKPLQPLTWYSLHRPTLQSPIYPSGDREVDYCLLWIAVILAMTEDSSVSTLFDGYRRQWNLLDRIFDHEPSASNWSWVQGRLDIFLWSSWFAERAETSWKAAFIVWQRKQGVGFGD